MTGLNGGKCDERTRGSLWGWVNRDENGCPDSQNGSSGAESGADVVKIGPYSLGILGGGALLWCQGARRRSRAEFNWEISDRACLGVPGATQTQ